MTSSLENQVFELVERASASLEAGEVLLASFAGEETDFVRFNGARVRQAMTIRQSYLTLSLVRGNRRDSTTLSLALDAGEDDGRIGAALRSMRDVLPSLPEDPYLLYSTEPSSSERVRVGNLPGPAEALDTILSAGRGTDSLVGLYASGPLVRGFASSLGHRHWYEASRVQFDFSLYQSTDKAVSEAFAAPEWDAAGLALRISRAKEKLEYLARPPVTLAPGSYRAYLSPAAMAEIVQLLSWDGVSEKAQRTKSSCLQKLVDGEATFSPKLTLTENAEDGLVPAFDELGFVKPARVSIVEAGRHGGSMVSPRTAKEYGIASNGAGPAEGLAAADLAAGSLPVDDALAALDTGVAIGNLWYLNFSDRQNGRITGMTRFATFWVEGGRIVCPVNVMRFDDSLFRVLGSELVDLTRERDFLPSTSTYGQRAVETLRLPGALLSGIQFTL